MSEKIFVSALEENQNAAKAIRSLAGKVKEGLGGKSCDLAILFVSEGRKEQNPEKILQVFCKEVSPSYLLACNCCGVLGDNHEIEMKPAFSVLAMHLPDVKFNPFYISPLELEHMKESSKLIESLDLYPTDNPKFISFADPYTCDVNKMLALFNEGYPDCPIVGGLASANVLGAPNWLAFGEEVYREGMIGLALVGNIDFQTVVSQGCRPIGEPYIITKCENNLVQQVAGKPAVQILHKLFSKLPEPDQELARNSLFVGIVMDENKQNFDRGDFLIRNIMGADQKNGTLLVGENLKVGQTIQFQLRDAKTSEEDLEIMLDSIPEGKLSDNEGAVLVSCCGRGKGLFREADHDVRMIQSKLGPLPLTGFFANGEFGPVGNKNYVHGYTSSLTIIK